LGLSDDDSRPSKQLETQLFGGRLIFGGEINTQLRGRYNYSLQDGDEDNEIGFTPELKLETLWQPADTVVTFVSVRAEHEFDLLRQGGQNERPMRVALENAWLLKTDLFNTPLAIQVGRQRLRERREWWWDESLDAIRVHYLGDKWSAYVGTGKPVGDTSASASQRLAAAGLRYHIAQLTWQWTNRHYLEAFALKQGDGSQAFDVGELVDSDQLDEKDASLAWLGARARGCVRMRFPRRICYWGELAQISGHETEYDFGDVNQTVSRVDERTRRSVSGSAYDVGVNLELPFWLRPVLTLGTARGSGDRPQTPGRDGEFRQTGLHQNDFKHRGNSRFRGYGEVLRPDLSNIEITTLALGIPVNESLWVEALWHRYEQVQPSERIAGSPLDNDPNGETGNLGDGLDIVLSHRPKSGWEFEFTAGLFRAAAAYGRDQGQWVGLMEVKLDFNF
jgi:alginate production protein